MRILKYAIYTFLGLLLFQTPMISQGQVDHQPWSKLLESHVKKDGNVDYKGFVKDKALLEAYLHTISTNPPQATWSKNEKLAYWINAYNAFTVKLIVDHYPLKSIQDLHPTIKIPGISTVWHKEFFEIGGEPKSLNDIEHKILRQQFDEPRIHFAINCASVSCPNLRAEAYTASKLNTQLDEQARLFINDSSKNELTTDSLRLSQIFNWFEADFTKKSTLIAFINQYTTVKINEKTSIKNLDYNWNLNE